MKKPFLLMILFLLCMIIISCSKKDTTTNTDAIVQDDTVYTVGITQFNDNESYVEMRKGIVQGLKEAGYSEGKNIIYKNQHAKGNKSYISQINNKFVEDGCDMIVAVGTDCALNAYDVCKDKNIKLVYGAVNDTKYINFTDKDLNPLVNATGTIEKYDIRKNLELIKVLFPEVKKVGIPYTKTDATAKRLVDEYKFYATTNNIDIVTIALNNDKDIELAYDALINKVDALMIINDVTIEKNAEYFINKCYEIKKPIFASSKTVVKKGAIGCYNVDYLQMGRETGKIAGRILNGEDCKTIQAVEVSDSKLFVNKNAIDVYGMDYELFEGATIYE